ncbi:MAG: YIP1 family protein [Candidatus Moduliflexus flocculans]|nr:YIP1 family protein [Candidatus Moduliflexus flocculans]
MNLLKRIQGVFFEPRPTFEGLAAKPVWIDTLVVVLLALIAFNLVVAPYMQRDQLALMKDNAALKERLGEDSFAKMIERMENPSQTSRIMQTFVITPLYTIVAILLQSLFLLIFGRFLSTQGKYVQALSALVHASLIDKLLGNAVRLVLALVRGSLMQTSTSLALAFPNLEVTSTPYIVLAQIDIFQLWMFGVLAFGLAAILKISLKKAMILSYGLWFLKALVNIGMGLVGTAFLR